MSRGAYPPSEASCDPAEPSTHLSTVWHKLVGLSPLALSVFSSLLA
jgi:hypothetical protein